MKIICIAAHCDLYAMARCHTSWETALPPTIIKTKKLKNIFSKEFSDPTTFMLDFPFICHPFPHIILSKLIKLKIKEIPFVGKTIPMPNFVFSCKCQESQHSGLFPLGSMTSSCYHSSDGDDSVGRGTKQTSNTHTHYHPGFFRVLNHNKTLWPHDFVTLHPPIREVARFPHHLCHVAFHLSPLNLTSPSLTLEWYLFQREPRPGKMSSNCCYIPNNNLVHFSKILLNL